MGRRGPPPKPTRLRILEGNPAHRPLPKNEPKPRVLEPDCPEWLDDGAKAEWERVVPVLLRLELLTEADGTALAAYCQAFATWQRATEVLQRKGLIFQTPSGYKQQRPEVAIANRAMALITRLCAEFGMTPSGRARMTLPDREGEHDDSPFGRSQDLS